MGSGDKGRGVERLVELQKEFKALVHAAAWLSSRDFRQPLGAGLHAAVAMSLRLDLRCPRTPSPRAWCGCGRLPHFFTQGRVIRDRSTYSAISSPEQWEGFKLGAGAGLSGHGCDSRREPALVQLQPSEQFTHIWRRPTTLRNRPSWVQGLDLNQRPSGYEGNLDLPHPQAVNPTFGACLA